MVTATDWRSKEAPAEDGRLRWSGEFLAPAMEEAFLAEQWPRTARQLRIAGTIAALGYLSAMYFNFLSFGADTPYYVMGVLRVLVAGLLLAHIHATYGAGRYTSACRALLACAEIALGLADTVEYHYYLELGGSAQDPGIPFILFAILVFYTVFPNRLALTLTAALASGSFLLVYLLAGPHVSPEAVAGYLPSLVVVNGMGIVVVRGLNRLTRRDFLRQRQLRHEIDARKLAQEAAERANQAKSRFLAMMNHELRTPLNGVLGGVQLLRESALSPEQREHAEIVERAGHQLAALIDDVLDLARIEAGRIELASQDFDLADLLADVEAILRPQMQERDLVLSLTLAGTMPTRLKGDPTRLRQVLINLGGNAIKFTERGEVAIEVTTLERRNESARLGFSVRDTGIGLTEEERQKVFAPFAQADDSISRRYGGSGLGLAICRELVAAMGGRIEVASVKGRGSSFSFALEFPAGCAAEPAVPDAAAEPALPCSLLLVEDAEANRVIAAALLERLGHRVTQAGSGAEGVRLAAQGGFDAILMDLHMPGMDGFEATRRIRALPERQSASVPIIALSADAQRGSIDACLGAGMQAFVPKPLSTETLMRTLAQVLAPRGCGLEVRAEWPAEARTDEETAPLIDLAHVDGIRTDLGGQRYGQVVETCLGALDALRHEIDRALDDEDWRRLGQAAHKLKGVAGNYGLLSLHQRVRDLEAAARNQDVVRAKRLHAEVKGLIEASMARLAATIAETPPPKEG